MGLMKEVYIIAIEEGFNVNKLNPLLSQGKLPEPEDEKKVEEILDKAWGNGSYQKMKEDILTGRYPVL